MVNIIHRRLFTYEPDRTTFIIINIILTVFSICSFLQLSFEFSLS